MQFNQNRSYLGVPGSHSFAIYNCDPFDGYYMTSKYGGVSVVEMLFSTSLIGIVNVDNPNNLRILNTKKDTCICELNFDTHISAVKMNRKRLVVVTQDEIKIFDVSCMKLVHTITVSPKNVKRKRKITPCELSSSNDSIFVYQQPSNYENDTIEGNRSHHRNIGNLIVFDTINLVQLSVLDCHKTDIETIALSENGVLLATCSTKGTIIRIFNTKTSIKLFEFRRGSLNATICSLCFNTDNTVLACSSDNGTIHFFRIPDQFASLGIPRKADLQSNTPQSVKVFSSNELPNLESTEGNISHEDEEEILKLINTADSGKYKRQMDKSNNMVSKNSKQLFKITNLIWNQSKNYIPLDINSIIDPKRDFTNIKLPTPCRSVVAMLDKVCYIATFNGEFYQYVISGSPSSFSSEPATQMNSEYCKLIKQHLIPPLL